MKRPGERQLRRSVRRLAARLKRVLPVLGPNALTRPQPATDWERSTDERLAAIEKSVNNQNRLLLFTIVSIVADAVYSVARK